MYISSIPGAGTTVEPTIPVSNTNEKSYYHEQSKLLCNTTVIVVDNDPDTLKRAANIPTILALRLLNQTATAGL